ncbi:MAG: hypothetical protein H6508_01840 [Calditrichaeota bacterium]|nr:hypothetical protein [Calditrichota bacterium]
MKKKLLLILALLILLPQVCGAWDGERKGFLLGIGFGAGVDSYSGVQYDKLGPQENSDTKLAFAASPRIGYAINDQVAFYYSRHPFLFPVKDAAGKDVAITSCIEALQAHYFLSKAAPSPYLGFGGGVGYFFDDSISNYSGESLKGIGVIATAGYEAIKHVSAEFSLHFKSPQSGATDVGATLLVTVLGY